MANKSSSAATEIETVAHKEMMRSLVQIVGMLPVLLVICILFAVITENFLTTNNLINVVRQASINIVLASGMTFVILTGGIDLAVGSVLGVTAVISLAMSLIPALSWAAIPIALLAGTAVGMGTGAIVHYFGLPPFIVTLGSYTALRGAAYLFAGGTTLINNDLPFAWIGNQYLGPIPWLVIIALVVVLVSAFILHRTILGVHIYAVGGNPLAARLTGIRVGAVLIFVYGLSGFLSGLGGVMTASRLYSAQGRLGEGYELDAIAAVILGGTSFSGGIGTVFGTLIGALIVAFLNNGLTLMNVSFYWQLVVKGAVIILAVLLDRLRTRGQTH
jgi:ribose transport system permease protein